MTTYYLTPDGRFRISAFGFTRTPEDAQDAVIKVALQHHARLASFEWKGPPAGPPRDGFVWLYAYHAVLYTPQRLEN